MLRLLLLVACLVLASCATTQQSNYIRVTGEGVNQDRAKENAFREAIQIRVGTVVLSEREATLHKINRDDINVYSAGYVDDYKIISVDRSNNKVKVTVDVLVADSKLVNQRLNTGKSINNIEGDKANDSYKTFAEQKKQGDKILFSVLRSYPESAYMVTQKPYSVSVNAYRNIVLQVPYKIIWNYDYIQAFNEALGLTEDNQFSFLQKAPSNVIVMAKNPKDLVLGEKKHYKFNDVPLLDRMKNAMGYDRQAMIMLVLKNNTNNEVYRHCWPTHKTFFSVGEPSYLVIFGNTVEENVLQLVIKPEYNQILEQSRNIEVKVVPHSKC